jgi:RimJ/RimL family protein N-acetyltransferase
VLADRGVDAITDEVDSTNTASLALHERLGAEITGADVELIYGRLI